MLLKLFVVPYVIAFSGEEAVGKVTHFAIFLEACNLCFSVGKVLTLQDFKEFGVREFSPRALSGSCPWVLQQLGDVKKSGSAAGDSTLLLVLLA